MIVGVKFCGGCNPRYDRKQVYNSLKEEFKDIEFNTAESCIRAGQNTVYDTVIVLCGCNVCCAEYKQYQTKMGYILIKSVENLDQTKQKIREISGYQTNQVY